MALGPLLLLLALSQGMCKSGPSPRTGHLAELRQQTLGRPRDVCAPQPSCCQTSSADKRVHAIEHLPQEMANDPLTLCHDPSLVKRHAPAQAQPR